MVATFLGVLAAFGLEHWATNRREAKATAALTQEREQLLLGLTDSMDSILASLTEANEADTWDDAYIHAVFLPVDFWHASRHRLIEVGVPLDTVAYFADFFHHVEQIGLLLRRASAGLGNAQLFHQLEYCFDVALDQGYDLARTWGGTKAKERWPWPRPEVKEKPLPPGTPGIKPE